jgi:hypothetical protein
MASPVDIDEVVNISIDIETGFRSFLLLLRTHLTMSSSQQALDMILNRIFPKSASRIPEDYFPDYPDQTFRYDIIAGIGPRDLVERILEYEEEHWRFYSDLREESVYFDSKETCDILRKHKEQQIRETKRIQDEIEMARCLGT